MMCVRCFGAALMSLAFLAGACVSAKAANLVVIEVRSIALRPGQTVDSTKPLVLRKASMHAHQPDGATIKLDGPIRKGARRRSNRAVPVPIARASCDAASKRGSAKFAHARDCRLAWLPILVLDASRARDCLPS